MLRDLYRRMDTIVLARPAPGRFRLLTPPPAWFEAFLPEAAGAEVPLDGLFPFLDCFLADADAFWSKGADGVLTSEPWVETGPDGAELPLEALAVVEAGQALLVLRAMGEGYWRQVRALQVAREKLLQEEVLEREILARTRDIRAREEEIALRLLVACGFRDHETGEHIRRIGMYSAVLAEALGWEPAHVSEIRLAAPMHDIGKIAIPDRILTKPGGLTPAERRIMESHTLVGARMLEGTGVEMLELARAIALGHHEHWDGTGYPHGVSAEEIPEAARIVAVVDVYDAMVHGRVYKDAIDEEAVLRHLRDQRGRQFDPRVVDAFLARIADMRRIRTEVRDPVSEPLARVP